MSFTEAIRDGFVKYVQFRGRSSRAAYWWWQLFNVIVTVAATIVAARAGTVAIYWLVTLALALPNLAVLVRRLHDAGHSGRWVLIAILPLIGFLVLLVFTLQRSEPANAWGDAADTVPATA